MRLRSNQLVSFARARRGSVGVAVVTSVYTFRVCTISFAQHHCVVPCATLTSKRKVWCEAERVVQSETKGNVEQL